MADTPQTLAGKILLFRAGGTQAVMRDVQFENINSRLFAVGTVPRGAVPGCDQKTIAIAWDEVELFYVFDTVEDYRAARKDWKAQPLGADPSK
jgi:hypothetical protein